MIVIDIKSSMPTQEVAEMMLKQQLNGIKNKVKIVKILHGYGSTGVGGSIKTMAHNTLKSMMARKQIKAYVPGEAIYQTLGFDEVIRRYKPLMVQDSDFKKGNPGITYVIV